MPRKVNTPEDVFRNINMHSGDTEACWEWTASLGGSDNRPYFSIKGKRRLAYRIVYELYHGVTLERREQVLHQCDNPACCNPHHLKAGTHQENMDEMKERERHGLPHNTVKAIKRLLAAGCGHAEIGDKYGVSRQTVTAINTGAVYTHVTLGDECSDG